MIVPANQPVSFTVYMQAIYNGVTCPAEFIRAKMARISRAYDMGEPIRYLVEEMQFLYDHRPQHTKTPRQLARRAVKVGAAGAIEAIREDLSVL